MVTTDEAVAETRRGILAAAGGGLGVAAAVALEACGSARHRRTTTTTTKKLNPGPDVPILNHGLDLKHMAIIAYTAATPLLPHPTREAAQRFLSQEIVHSGEFAGLVHQDGGKPVKPRLRYDLGNPVSTDDVLALLYRIERLQVSFYLQSIQLLSKNSTRAAVAAILANDAQHATVVALALGRDPVPGAFAD